MAYAIVGSPGAFATISGSSGGGAAWGAGANRTQRNLLLFYVSAYGFSASAAPPPPWGWSLAVVSYGASTFSAVYYKVADGGDAAPVLPGGFNGTYYGHLEEWSNTGLWHAVDETGGATGTAQPQVTTLSGVEDAVGGLVAMLNYDRRSTSRAPNHTWTSNNGTPVLRVSNNGVNTTGHYSRATLVTTANASPSTLTMTPSVTTSITVLVSAAASFKPLAYTPPFVLGVGFIGSALAVAKMFPVDFSQGAWPNGPATVGARFTVMTSGDLTHIRWWHMSDTASQTHLMTLWSDSGAVLQQWNYTHATNPGELWLDIALPVPQPVYQGQTYRVSWGANAPYIYMTSTDTLLSVSGNSALRYDGSFLGAAATFPNTASDHLAVDVLLAPWSTAYLVPPSIATIGPPPQAVAVEFVSATAVVYAPSAVALPPTLRPDLLSVAAALYTPTLLPGPVAVAVAQVSSTPALYAPTSQQVSAQKYLTVPLLDASPGLSSPTLVAAAPTLVTPLLFTNPDVFSPVLFGQVALSLSFITSTSTTYAPAIDRNAYAHLPFLFTFNDLFPPAMYDARAELGEKLAVSTMTQEFWPRKRTVRNVKPL